MNKIFLAPRSNETSYKNFVSTIDSGIDYLIIEPYLNKEGKELLSPTKKIFAWGNRESKKSSWDKMENGDTVLFYKGKEKEENQSKFLYAGKVLHKQHSKELGLALWPPKKGEEPWTCVFFLEELTPVYIPISAITDLSENYHFSIVQGFMPINDEANSNLIKKYGSVDNFIKEYKINESEETTDLEDKNQKIAHREAQMLLLKIGKLLGFETYCPDKSFEAYGEKLGDYTTLDSLPGMFIGKELVPFVSKIDVIWFNQNVPEYAFEVEETTGIGSGLNRLNQLTPIAKKLFIIAPEKEFFLYQKFLNGNTYSKDKEKFTFKDYGKLERYFNSVSEFAALKKSFLDE